METRKFKGTQDISLLGFGAMRFSQTKVDGKDVIDYEASEKTIDYAYENGVNYFDTAYVYHNGESEVFLGKALKKYPRDSFYVADKMPMWELKTEDDAERLFNEQLERLDMPYIDFYLMHALGRYNFDQGLKFNIYDFMKKKQAEGKIKYIGFSFHDNVDVLKEIVDKYEWDFAQIQLNYLDWETQNSKGQYEILKNKGIPAIIMEPVRGGALADLCDSANKLFTDARPDQSIASWAMRYAGTFDNVITVLSGMSNMDQVVDNIKTISNFEPITDSDMAIIEKASKIYRNRNTIPCTGCQYCMPCPANVEIPTLFKLFNDYAIKLDPDGFKSAYKEYDEGKKACIQCGACEELCPQSIKIRDMLASFE